MEAAKKGRTDDIIALLAEGVNIDHNTQVRSLIVFDVLVACSSIRRTVSVHRHQSRCSFKVAFAGYHCLPPRYYSLSSVFVMHDA